MERAKNRLIFIFPRKCLSMCMFFSIFLHSLPIINMTFLWTGTCFIFGTGPCNNMEF